MGTDHDNAKRGVGVETGGEKTTTTILPPAMPRLREEEGDAQLNTTAPSSMSTFLNTSPKRKKHEESRHHKHLREEPMTVKEHVELALNNTTYSYEGDSSCSWGRGDDMSSREKLKPWLEEWGRSKDDDYDGGGNAGDNRVAVQGKKNRQPLF